MCPNRRDFLKMAGMTAFGSVALNKCRSPKSELEEDPFASLKNMTADIKPFEKSDFENRHNQARSLMRKEGIDVLFLSGSTNLYYFSGINKGGRDRLFALLLPQIGAPTFICPAFEVPSVMELIKYGEEDLRTWEEHEDPFKLTADILQEKGIDKGVIGVDEHMPFWYYYKLSQAAPQAKYRDADIITHELRAGKSSKEIAFIRRAVDVTIQAYKATLKTIHLGMSQGEFRRNFASAASRLGSRGGGGASFGPASSFVHGSIVEVPLEEGMVILMDCGCRVENYKADVSRTITQGKPSDKVLKAWETSRKAQLAGIKAVRPGAACQEVDRAIRRVLEEEGYGPGYKNLSHRVGHGIGLDVHEGPWLVEGDTTPMKVGMTFAFDGAIQIPGEFGIRLEDDVVVTEDGCEVFGNCLSSAIDKPFSC